MSEAEYRTLGRLLKDVRHDKHYGIHAEVLRLIALTGCRRGEIISLRWSEVDIEGSCLRLKDSKEGASVRPVGLPVIDYLEAARLKRNGTFVYAGLEDGVDNHWGSVFVAAGLATILNIGLESGEDDGDEIAQAIRDGTQDTIGRAGEAIVQRQLGIPPTLTIRPGLPVRVMVTLDLILAPEGASR